MLPISRDYRDNTSRGLIFGTLILNPVPAIMGAKQGRSARCGVIRRPPELAA